jgi:hypothetical protein
VHPSEEGGRGRGGAAWASAAGGDRPQDGPLVKTGRGVARGAQFVLFLIHGRVTYHCIKNN